jgi:hypothetical protein
MCANAPADAPAITTHRGRQVQLRASAKGWAQMYLKENPWTYNRRSTRTEYEQAALQQGHIAINSVLRDWIKGQVTDNSDKTDPWVKCMPKKGWSSLAVDQLVASRKLPLEDLRVFGAWQRETIARLESILDDESYATYQKRRREDHRKEMQRRYGMSYPLRWSFQL